MQTNTSMFERNPFQDYTTNKIRDMLQNKSTTIEIKQVQAEAVKYGKDVQMAYIERIADKEEVSPKSV
jgi:hypothetical protein